MWVTVCFSQAIVIYLDRVHAENFITFLPRFQYWAFKALVIQGIVHHPQPLISIRVIRCARRSLADLVT